MIGCWYDTGRRLSVCLSATKYLLFWRPGYIIQPQHIAKTKVLNVRVWNSHGQIAWDRSHNRTLITKTMNLTDRDFLARDSIYAIARSLLTPARPSVRPSVCPAVCHTGGSVKDGYS